MPQPLLDISCLTPDEKIDLAGALWDSFAVTPEAVCLTDAQGEELDRRLEGYRKDRNPGTPWRKLSDGLQSRGNDAVPRVSTTSRFSSPSTRSGKRPGRPRRESPGTCEPGTFFGEELC
jgi:putative addiction module component (TIGR02574 family)